MNIAIIPARGGSKRIHRKNVKTFCGKPMIAWSIGAARASGCFDRIIVSTDDDEIARIAEDYGAEAPFRRPAELSDDHTPTVPVIAHAVRWLQQSAEVENACCIYATAPLLLAMDLRAGYEALQGPGVDYAFSVTSFAFPVQRALMLDGAGRVAMFQPDHADTRSQDLVDAYHDAGQFYWGRGEAWLDERPVFTNHSVAVRLPRKRVQDIDTLEDWERAEILFKMMHMEEASVEATA